MDAEKPESLEETMKIIPLNDSIGKDLEVKKKKTDIFRKCSWKHRHVTVDEQLRTVTCDDCGFVIDAFDYLLAWAADGERRMDGLKALSVQTRINQAEHDDLLRRIKNMRATLKRGGEPQPAKERQNFDVMRWNPKRVTGLDYENQKISHP